MSQFNKFARKADELAREQFAAYREAEDAYNKAVQMSNAYPRRNGFVDAEYAAKSARAEADMVEAKSRLWKARDAMQAQVETFDRIRAELSEALDAHYAADPSALDANTITLMQSGIMKAADYKRFMDTAVSSGNHTMARLISKYAMDAADAEQNSAGTDTKEAQALRAVSYSCDNNPGANELHAFDVMREAYYRTSQNTAMIDSWTELTENIVENL